MNKAAVIPSAVPNAPTLDRSLRDYLETNAEIVTRNRIFVVLSRTAIPTWS